MKKAIIIHGMPDKEEYYNLNRADSQSNSQWIPWLQQQLLQSGVLAQALEMPHPYKPEYSEWKKVFDCLPVDEDTMLIGHSGGAGFLVRWSSENPDIQAGKVALVAPWLDPEGELGNDFFDFDLDRKLGERVEEIAIFVSSDDESSVITSVENLKQAWPDVRLFNFEHHGHFTLGDMGTREFPELREFLLG